MQFYRDVAEAYLLIGVVVSPIFCILGWVLLGQILSKRLSGYAAWYTPLAIAASLSASALLLEAFVGYYDPRDYGLRAGVYLLTLAGVPFHLVSFVRLWKTISRLPPSVGDSPPTSMTEQDESVWPPQPKMPPSPQ